MLRSLTLPVPYRELIYPEPFFGKGVCWERNSPRDCRPTHQGPINFSPENPELGYFGQVPVRQKFLKKSFPRSSFNQTISALLRLLYIFIDDISQLMTVTPRINTLASPMHRFAPLPPEIIQT